MGTGIYGWLFRIEIFYFYIPQDLAKNAFSIFFLDLTFVDKSFDTDKVKKSSDLPFRKFHN